MSSTKRVFITGLGALTASGTTDAKNWASILGGVQNIDEIQSWDIASWSHRLGGELKEFQPAKFLPDRKLMKVISRQDVLGINAAMQAIESSQLQGYRDSLDNSEEFNDKTAVFVGSPGNKYYQQYDFLPLLAKTKGDMRHFAKQLFAEVHPMWLLRILPNNVLAYTGITYGFKGVNHNVTNHAAGGMQALIEAYHAIKTGQAERAVVVAYDTGTEPQALFYYNRLGVISSRHLKPFDAEHDGTILGEGAAAIVIESETSVNAREAVCYAELLEGASTTEAASLFSIEEDGSHLAALLAHVLYKNGIQPEEVGLLVAHGNGNKKSDVSEAIAISSVFGQASVPVTAYKWSMGHTLCASGILDTVLAVHALRDGCVPGIPNLVQPAPECAQLNISHNHRSMESGKKHALVINRGFASMNACLLLKACT